MARSSDMPANRIFSASELSDLRRVYDDVSHRLDATGFELPAAVIAEAVMNCAAYCSDSDEICSRAVKRLSLGMPTAA